MGKSDKNCRARQTDRKWAARFKTLTTWQFEIFGSDFEELIVWCALNNRTDQNSLSSVKFEARISFEGGESFKAQTS